MKTSLENTQSDKPRCPYCESTEQDTQMIQMANITTANDRDMFLLRCPKCHSCYVTTYTLVPAYTTYKIGDE